MALLLGGLSAALALTLPLSSHLAAAPALALAASTAARRLAPGGAASALLVSAIPSAAAALVLLPPALLLPHILGAPAAVASAALAALCLVVALAPAIEAGRPAPAPAVIAFALAAFLAAAQAALPHATVSSPERLTFVFHEEGGEARWFAEAEHDSLPEGVRAAAAFSPERAVPLAWQPLRRGFTAPAPAAGLAPPRLDVLALERAGGARRVRARLSSARGAPVVFLLLPPDARVAAVSVGGIPLPAPPRLALAYYAGHRLIACVTTPPEGVLLEVALEGDSPVEAIVVDQSPGLPPEGDALVRARPPTAVPSWYGDVTLAVARVEI